MNLFGSGRPLFTDEFVGRAALESFEPAREIVGGDEVRQRRFELLMAVVMIPFDGCFPDGSVHAFDLAVGPWVFNLGEPMFDAVLAAAHVEHVGDVGGRRPISVSRRKGELDTLSVRTVWIS